MVLYYLGGGDATILDENDVVVLRLTSFSIEDLDDEKGFVHGTITFCEYLTPDVPVEHNMEWCARRYFQQENDWLVFRKEENSEHSQDFKIHDKKFSSEDVHDKALSLAIAGLIDHYYQNLYEAESEYNQLEDSVH
jgi:hypothetical protein